MSAVERAARLLEHERGLHRDAAIEDAQALADAGLLVTDDVEGWLSLLANHSGFMRHFGDSDQRQSLAALDVYLASRPS